MDQMRCARWGRKHRGIVWAPKVGCVGVGTSKGRLGNIETEINIGYDPPAGVVRLAAIGAPCCYHAASDLGRNYMAMRNLFKSSGMLPFSSASLIYFELRPTSVGVRFVRLPCP